MKFVFFGNETVRNAGVRYRVVKQADRLETYGHTCILCLPSTVGLWKALYGNRPKLLKLLYLVLVLFRRIVQLHKVVGADAVFVKGPLFPYGPPILERLLGMLNPRIVFDIDDAMWEPPAFVTSPFVTAVDYNWARKMTFIARHAIAGNKVLADYLRDCGGCSTTIIPTCIDMDHHFQKTYTVRPEKTPVVLGWIGINSNLGYLDAIADALRELARHRPLELLVVSDGKYCLDEVSVRNVPWTPENEISVLHEADIGLMPLVNTPRACGKCAFKALQLMGVGTPVVLSPIGMNVEVVEDGVSGFLANTIQEWHDRLAQLADNPSLRERIGRAGRDRVADKYSFDIHAPRLRSVLEAIAQEKEPDAPCP